MQIESVVKGAAKPPGTISRGSWRATEVATKERGKFVGLTDLMVHLDGTEEDETRLAHAEAIAMMSDAHLAGLYTNLLPGLAIAGDVGGAGAAAMLEVEERLRREGTLTFERLGERFSRLAVTNELRRIDDIPGAMARLVAIEARCSDLFVATCPYRENASANWDDVVEAILFESGHGVYFVPPAYRPRKLSRVLAAWAETRESTRALSEALPFLRAASEVEIVIVDASGGKAENRGYAAVDIAAHLDRQGAKVAIRSIAKTQLSVSEVLLEETRKRTADLIVMGAYGHSRWREWIMGGTTREMLASAEVPILMAH